MIGTARENVVKKHFLFIQKPQKPAMRITRGTTLSSLYNAVYK